MIRGLFALLPAVAGALLASQPAAAQAPADAVYAERVRALGLDERCGLFSEEVRTALDAGAALARNTLFRGGWSDADVSRLTRAAVAEAGAVACQGAAAVAIVGQVEAGYDGWRRLPGMTFPGEQRTWTAARRDEGWLLIQNIAGIDHGPALFGLARDAEGAVRPALGLASDLRPMAARVLLRDPALAPRRVEAEFVRLATSRDSHPLAVSAAPDVFTRAVWASEQARPEKDSPYAVEFPDGMTLLWFPPTLIDDLARLDPREVVAIDLDLRANGGFEEPLRLYVEVGDFAPAAAFVRMQSAD